MFESSQIRPPAVAGSFYPGDPGELRRMVTGFLNVPDTGEVRLQLRALIAPHAGYMFSGAVAGRAYAAVSRPFRRVLNLGPSHYIDFNGIATISRAQVATPLGTLPVENGASLSKLVIEADQIHAPEHALETHWPFLQQGMGAPTLIPWLTGRVSDRDVADLAASLLDEDTLLAVSSDLSHFLSGEDAAARDLETARAIEALDPEGVSVDGACGSTAVRVLLRLARERGWQCRRLALCTSGDVTGDYSRVVGYGAWIFGEAE